MSWFSLFMVPIACTGELFPEAKRHSSYFNPPQGTVTENLPEGKNSETPTSSPTTHNPFWDNVEVGWWFAVCLNGLAKGALEGEFDRLVELISQIRLHWRRHHRKWTSPTWQRGLSNLLFFSLDNLLYNPYASPWQLPIRHGNPAKPACNLFKKLPQRCSSW